MVEIYESRFASGYVDVVAEMAADGHGVPNVTHVVISRTALVGAFSVAYAPCLFFWMHTKRASARDSYRAFKEAVKILEGMGHANPILLTDRSSPFYPFIRRLGYTYVGQGEIFMKG